MSHVEAAEYVRRCLLANENPNDIALAVEDALEWLATDWALWGDGVYRRSTVCSFCGSPYAGVCGHRHLGSPVLRREYLKQEKAQK